MASEAFWAGISSQIRQDISALIPPEQLEEQLPPMVHTQPVQQKQALLLSILDAFAHAHHRGDQNQNQNQNHNHPPEAAPAGPPENPTPTPTPNCNNNNNNINLHVRALHVMGALQTDMNRTTGRLGAEATYRRILTFETSSQVDIDARQSLVRTLMDQQKCDEAAVEIGELSARIRVEQGAESPNLVMCSQLLRRNEEVRSSSSGTIGGRPGA